MDIDIPMISLTKPSPCHQAKLFDQSET